MAGRLINRDFRALKKILFLTPYPYDTAGSQRFRFEQYYTMLLREGFEVERKSFISNQTWDILYTNGAGLKKFFGTLVGFVNRTLTLFQMGYYDYVFIHREAAPIGPPLFEWWIAKIMKKKVIYDFDDSNMTVARWKWHMKVASICKWSYKVSVGNEFLAEFARKFSRSVFINPTTIDSENMHIPRHVSNEIPVIGWTGTHSTLRYLREIIESLQILSNTHRFDFLVIADRKPSLEIPNLIYKPWSKETEVDDLNSIDIGVMPLENNEWAQGKCGFKALQFMAIEKPVLVSPVGVNASIVDHGVSGFHCSSKTEWVYNMKRLLDDRKLRIELGKEGRKTVVEKYSLESNKENFLSFFS